MNRFTEWWHNLGRRVVRQRTINQLISEMTLEQAEHFYGQEKQHREHELGCTALDWHDCITCRGNAQTAVEQDERYTAAREIVHRAFPTSVNLDDQAFKDGLRAKTDRQYAEYLTATTDTTTLERTMAAEDVGRLHDEHAATVTDEAASRTFPRVLDQPEATARSTVSDDVLREAQRLDAAVMRAHTLDNTPRGFINPDTDEDEWGFDDHSELINSTEAALMTYLREHPELEQHPDFQAWYMPEDDPDGELHDHPGETDGWPPPTAGDTQQPRLQAHEVELTHEHPRVQDTSWSLDDHQDATEPARIDEQTTPHAPATGNGNDIEALARSMTPDEARRWFQRMQDSRIHDLNCGLGPTQCTTCYTRVFIGDPDAKWRAKEAARQVMSREDPARVAFADAAYSHRRAELRREHAPFNRGDDFDEVFTQLETEMNHRARVLQTTDLITHWRRGAAPRDEQEQSVYTRLDWEAGNPPHDADAARLHATWDANPDSRAVRHLPYDGEDPQAWYRRHLELYANTTWATQKNAMTLAEARRIQQLAQKHSYEHLDVQLAFANETIRQAENHAADNAVATTTATTLGEQLQRSLDEKAARLAARDREHQLSKEAHHHEDLAREIATISNYKAGLPATNRREELLYDKLAQDNHAGEDDWTGPDWQHRYEQRYIQEQRWRMPIWEANRIASQTTRHPEDDLRLQAAMASAVRDSAQREAERIAAEKAIRAKNLEDARRHVAENGAAHEQAATGDPASPTDRTEEPPAAESVMSEAEANYYATLTDRAAPDQQTQYVADRADGTGTGAVVAKDVTHQAQDTSQRRQDGASMTFGFTTPSTRDEPADTSALTTQQLVDLASDRLAQHQPTGRTEQDRAAQLAGWHTDTTTQQDRSHHHDAL